MNPTDESPVCPVCQTRTTVRSYTAMVRGELRAVLLCTVCNIGAVLA